MKLSCRLTWLSGLFYVRVMAEWANVWNKSYQQLNAKLLEESGKTTPKKMKWKIPTLFGYGIILKMPWKTRIKWMARCCDYKLHTQCSRHIYYFLCFSLLIHFKASHESWNLCVSGLRSLLWVLKAARGSCVFSLDLYFLTPSRLWTTVLSVPLCGASLYWPSLLTS